MQLSTERDHSITGDEQSPKLKTESTKNQLLYLSLILLLVGIASRLPLQSHILHHWDSVNFGFALENFDVRLHQPHPPGTFVLYILSGRLFNLYLDDGNRSLVLVSLVATGLAAAVIFLLAAAWTDRRTAIIVSLMMLTSPLIWFQGEVALSYMPEFFYVLLIVYVCLKTRDASKSSMFIASLLIGLAGGVRPNTPFFLFPLWLFVLIRGLRARTYSAKDVLLAIGLIALGVLIWAVPMIKMSGGIAAYWDAINWWRRGHLESSATAQGIALHLMRLAVFVLYAIGAALLPLIWVVLKDWRVLKEKLLQDWRAQALSIWILPGLAYYIFIHVQQSGHTFTIMPAVILLAGFSIVRLGNFLSQYNRNALLIVTSVVVVSNALFFIFGPTDIFGVSRVTLIPPTREAIHQYDDYVSIRLEAIHKHFSPQETIIIAGSRNFRIPDYYLREYQNTSLSYQLREEFIALPDHVNTLVIFDDELAEQLSTDSIFETLSLPQGSRLHYVRWGHEQEAKLSRVGLRIQSK